MSNRRDMTDQVIEKIKDKVGEKVESGEINGEINEWILILSSATHDSVEQNKDRLKCLEGNLSIKLGNFIKNRPLIAYALSQITALILVVTSMAIALGLIDKLGLSLVIKP